MGEQEKKPRIKPPDNPKDFYEKFLPEQFAANPKAKEKIADMDAIFQFVLEGEGGGTWCVIMKNGDLTVKNSADENAHCTITQSTEDWGAMMRGELNPQQAFMSGKIQITGDMGLAMQIGTSLMAQ